MVFRVEKEELAKAEGTMKYTDCKSYNGKALVGAVCSWKDEQDQKK